MDTLFGHLATKFAASPENMAIDALGYILSRSKAAREGLAQHLGVCGIRTPDGTRFVTQSTEGDGARPDLEGVSEDGRKVCVIECKFWAGLTTNQPVTYAKRLPDDHAGILAFIVPSMRLNTLWGELSKRLRQADILLGSRKTHDAETLHADLAGRHGFVLTSWRGVLGTVIRSLEASHDPSGLGDARQLLGLCERMDQDAFLPFRSEMLTSLEVPRMYLQLTQLMSDVCDRLASDDAFSTKSLNGTRLTAASSRNLTGRYLRISKTTFMICFDCDAWNQSMTAPLWFTVDTDRFPYARQAARQYCEAHDLDDTLIDTGKGISVPLIVSPGVEVDHLIEDLTRQANTICNALVEAEAGKIEPEQSVKEDIIVGSTTRDNLICPLETGPVPKAPYYNGFDKDQRHASISIQGRAKRKGIPPKPRICTVTGFIEPSDYEGRTAIITHLEDYRRESMLAWLPCSKKVHYALHARFAKPEAWYRIVYDNYRHGAWFTLLSMNPECRHVAYQDLYPDGLPGPDETWPDMADRLGIHKERFNPDAKPMSGLWLPSMQQATC